MVSVFVPWPATVEPEPWTPFTRAVAPMRQVIVGAGVPVIVDVKVAVPPTQLVKFAGLVTIGKVFTVILALATRSATGTLSTCVFTNAVPPVPLEVNVAVAVPDACIVPC